MTKAKHFHSDAELALLHMPSDFIHIRKLLYSLLAKVPKIGRWLSKLYGKLWNPINYAIIGGIGVLINYLVWAVTMPLMPWFLSNALAIAVAWSWNWSQAVGHFSYLWGFRKKNDGED